MTALIIDDEPLSRQELHFLLREAGDVYVVGEGSNGIEAVDLIRQYRPDVVFLDVQMPGLDGFAVLRRLLDRQAPVPEVVFATAFDQYAVRAFEVNAVDYLLKPFEKKRVLQTIEKTRVRLLAREPATLDTTPVAPIRPRPSSLTAADLSPPSVDDKLDTLLRLFAEQQAAAASTSLAQGTGATAPTVGGSSGRIVVRAQNRLLLVDQREVCFVSIDDGSIQVVTPALQGLSTARTLEELSELLDSEMFWRVHRSYIVNLQHIREVVPWFRSTYQLRMDDPARTEIPVARAQTKRLKELFNL